MSTFFRLIKITIGGLGILVIALIYFGKEVGEIYSPMSACTVGVGNNSFEWIESNRLGLFWNSNSFGSSSFVLTVDISDKNAEIFSAFPIQKAFFSSWHNSSEQIFYTSLDGRIIYKFDVISQEESIIESSGWQQDKSFISPTSSLNGQKIAYFVDNDLYVRNLHSSWWVWPQKIIDVPLRSPTSYSIDWHPQKPWTTYSSSRDIMGSGYSYSQIFFTDLEKKEEQLLSGAFGCAFTPQWSPDGEWVAYITTRPFGVESLGDIFVVAPPNQSTTNVTNTPLISERHISWSPDGRKILFTGYITNEETNQRASDLFIVDVATKEQTQLTDTPHLNEFQPVWSEDGRRIAFLSEAADADRNNPVWALEILDLETMTRTTLGEISDECVIKGDCFSVP